MKSAIKRAGNTARPYRPMAGLALALTLGFWVHSDHANAGGTGSTALVNIIGSGAATSQGDYISSAAGLDTRYNFFIEVPSGSSSLQIDIFDADVNNGGAGGNDVVRTAANSAVRYQVRDPSGTTQATINLSSASCGTLGTCNNAWVNIYTQASPTAGHWQVRVFMSSGITPGDDINGFGIRAHDGTPGAGGTEYNVYANSMFASGRVTSNGTNVATLYPWVHSGCNFDANDFDTDRTSTTGNSWAIRDRTTSFNVSYANANLSTNNAWVQHNISGWTTNQSSSGYGIWRSVFTIAANSGVTENTNVYYFGVHDNNDAANPPPTGNPESQTYRIYLPTDAGAAPVKPYLEQYVGHRSGGNPFTIGQSTRAQITVRVYNPTAGAILVSGTFNSNDREVITRVPSNATLAVAPTVTQGTVTAQPSVGGNGAIRWQPGSIAAGGNAAISWEIDVTPADGSLFLLSGDETTGQGTRMLYRDETADDTNNPANQTIGTLCGLRGQATVSVYASIADIAARTRDGVATVEWDTSSEIGSFAFVVERQNPNTHLFEPIHDGMVPALLDAPQGGHYVVRDESGASRRGGLYRIREIDVRGNELVHGPFNLAGSALQLAATPAFLRDGYLRAARFGTPVVNLPSRFPHFGGRADTAGLDAVHIAVQERGIHRVSAESIASALGRPASEVVEGLRTGNFTLTRRGASVAWTKSASDDALIFFANASESIYSNDTIYRLAFGAGETMRESALGAAVGGATASTFVATRHIEQEIFPGTAVAPDAESDYWYWRVVSSLNPDLSTGTFDLPLDGASAEGEAHLVVRAFGVTANLHTMHIAVNGVDIGDVHTEGSGFGPTTLPIVVPAGVLHEGNNVVALTAVRNGDVNSSFYIDSFDVSYPRSFVADNGQLEFRNSEAGDTTLTGFASSDITVFDVSATEHPLVVSGLTIAPAAEGTTLTLHGSPTSSYVAATNASMLTPIRVWGDSSSSLHAAANAAQYIIVAPDGLHDQAVRLANLRVERGLTAMVVDLEDIYDEFNYGDPNPHAIADFLRHADQTWAQKPQYVALAGTQTFDYRNVQGMGGNLVPSIMIRTSHGLFPSDNSFVDFDHDGAPDLAIGRLPVSNSDELSALVDKTARYESGTADGWGERVLLLADATLGADFAEMTSALAQRIPRGFETSTINVDDVGVETAHSDLVQQLNDGVLALNYLGHGGTDRLSSGGLLSSEQAFALTNADHLPVVTAASCLVSGFGLPGFSSVGEQLVRNPVGGAIAVWSPSSITDATLSHEFAQNVLQAVLHGERRPLGDAVAQAVRFLVARDSDPTTMATFALLGDPALLLQSPVAPPLEPRDPNSVDDDTGTLHEGDPIPEAPGIPAPPTRPAPTIVGHCGVTQPGANMQSSLLVGLAFAGIALALRRRRRA